jgi:short-subunit dehydrogenase
MAPRLPADAASLSGSVAIVTGASSGIGRSIAVALAGLGVTVVGAGRNQAQLDQLAVITHGSSFACDLREPGSSEALVAAALERHGRLDIVVANAGVGYAGDLADLSPERLTELVEINVTAPLQLARACLPSMLAQGSGRLLFVTSIAGALGVPGESVYSATKAAVETFADVLREEVRAGGITVSTLLPGVVDTEFFERRGRPYDRKSPRPMPPARVASAAVGLLVSGRRSSVVPRWLSFPIRLRAVAPGVYRWLERRFG